jgi:tRNA pseudouridine38-40 synthase
VQILLTIAYDGTRYAGWQRQTNGLAVQQVIEDILATLLDRPVTLRAASRTDAGVHALGQRAAFDGEGLKIPLEKLPQVLNGYLPKDISVTGLITVPDNFNPRHALNKTYRYQIYNALCPNPLMVRYATFISQHLDFTAMQKAACMFIGRHDFKALCASPQENQSTVREIYKCEISREGPLLTLTVTGNGFLYNMVRILTGTVLYAGLNKIQPESIPEIISSRDRTRAGKTMPPEGLTLMEAVY